MVIKSKGDNSFLADIEETLRQLWWTSMKLNPIICVFGAHKGKFLGYIITTLEIEANSEKVDMTSGKTSSLTTIIN